MIAMKLEIQWIIKAHKCIAKLFKSTDVEKGLSFSSASRRLTKNLRDFQLLWCRHAPANRSTCLHVCTVPSCGEILHEQLPPGWLYVLTSVRNCNLFFKISASIIQFFCFVEYIYQPKEKLNVKVFYSFTMDVLYAALKVIEQNRVEKYLGTNFFFSIVFRWI